MAANRREVGLEWKGRGGKGRGLQQYIETEKGGSRGRAGEQAGGRAFCIYLTFLFFNSK